MSVSATRSYQLADARAGLSIAVDLGTELPDAFGLHGGAVYHDDDPDPAIAGAGDQFRWFGGGWKVDACVDAVRAYAEAAFIEVALRRELP